MNERQILEIQFTRQIYHLHVRKGRGKSWKWLQNPSFFNLGSLFIDIWKEEWGTSFDKKDIEFNFAFLRYILNNHVKINKTCKRESVIRV